MTKFVDKLISAAEDEWEFFGQSVQRLDGTTVVGRVEYQDGVYLRVNDYWKVVHNLYKPQYAHLTGRDRSWPWSAAFISFCMAEAGAGNLFAYSSGHSRYINRAIKAMKADGDGDGAIYRAHKRSDHSLKKGDMVAYWRGEKKITIDNAVSTGWYMSHCDIVTEVGENFVHVIGGNVMHSVTRKALRTNDAGNLTDTSEKWFTVLECQR